MESNESKPRISASSFSRSGKERRQHVLPFPKWDELRRNPDRRQPLKAAVAPPKSFWQTAQTSLLRFLARS